MCLGFPTSSAAVVTILVTIENHWAVMQVLPLHVLLRLELQGDGTPHGHGFAALANRFQYNSLDCIADMLEHNIHILPAGDMVTRITSFMEHVQ